MVALNLPENKFYKPTRLFWLNVGALACLPSSVSLAQKPEQALPAKPVQRLCLYHIVEPATRRIGNVEIKATLRYGNAGLFDPAKAQQGDWTGITFVVTNHSSKRFVFSDQFVRMDLDSGGHVTADQSDTLHGTPFVTTEIAPGAHQVVNIGPFGYRLPIKRLVYMGNKHRLAWKCAPVPAHSATPSTRRASASLHYTITNLGTLGGRASGAHAIDDRGDVVGWAETTESGNGLHPHAFLWRNGSMLDLGEGDANAVNRHGQVVGRLGSRAFLYQDSKVQFLEVRADNAGQETGNQNKDSADRSEAVAINDQGQIVGRTTGAHEIFSWIWQDGQVLRLPGAWAMDINNNGHLAGQWKGRPGIYANGKWRDLGTFGGEYGIASRINDADEALGSADTKEIVDTGDDRAGAVAPLAAPFVWQNGKMIRLAEQGGSLWKGKPSVCHEGKFFGIFPYVPDGKGGLCRFTQLLPAASGWTDLIAAGINRSGQIVGTGKIKGCFRAFLLSPSALHPAP